MADFNEIDWSPITNDQLKWVGLDFDGTLAKNSVPPEYRMQEATEGAIETVLKLREWGLRPAIWTARHSADYVLLEKWCQFYNIPMKRIVPGKELWLCSVDDRHIEFDTRNPSKEEWQTVRNKIRTRFLGLPPEN